MIGLLVGGICPNQGKKIFVKHFLFAIRQIFEAHKDVIQLIVCQINAQIFELGAQRGAAGVFAHDQVGFAQSNIFRPHDLKGLGIFQHAILVNPALMGKGIFSDDGFIKLHRKA